MARCQTKFATKTGLDGEYRVEHLQVACGLSFIMRNQQFKAAASLIFLGAGAALLWNFRARAGANANPPKPTVTIVVLGQPFEVEIGKSTAIPSEKLDVSFERVTEDSRCPKDMDCYWAGQISVVVGLKKAGKKLGTALLTVQGSRYVTPKSIGKIGPYWVKLTEVSPEKGPQNAPGTAKLITLVVQNKPFAAPKNGK